MRIRSLLTVVLLASTSFAQTQPTTTTAPTSQPSKEIADLVDQLSSQLECTRDRAIQRLLATEEGKSALEAHLRSVDPKSALIGEIQTRRLADTTTVTLKMRDARPEDVFAAIAKQTGFTIVVGDANTWQQAKLPAVSVDFDHKPFWHAFREVCAATNVGIDMTVRPDRRLELYAATGGSRSVFSASPYSINGPFFVAATGVQQTSMINFQNPGTPGHQNLVSLMVYVEPKVRLLRYTYQPEIEEMVDDRGKSLLVPQAANTGTTSNGTNLTFGVSVPFTAPDPAAKTIAKLRGHFRETIQTASETLEIKNIREALNVAKTVAGRSIEIKELKKLGNAQYEIRVVLGRGAVPQEEFFAVVNNPASSFLLTDADGAAWQYSGTRSSGGGNDAYTVTWIYQRTFERTPAARQAGEPSRLVWEVPTRTKDVSIPFTFADLPLP